jgi:hypothetical protein
MRGRSRCGCARVDVARTTCACLPFTIAPPHTPNPPDTTLLNVRGSSFLYVSVMLLLWRLGRQYGLPTARQTRYRTSNLSVRRRVTTYRAHACWACALVPAGIRAWNCVVHARGGAGGPCVLMPIRALLCAAGDCLGYAPACSRQRLRDLLDAPTALAACCGFDLCHKDILYLYLYFCRAVVVRACRARGVLWAHVMSPIRLPY